MMVRICQSRLNFASENSLTAPNPPCHGAQDSSQNRSLSLQEHHAQCESPSLPVLWLCSLACLHSHLRLWLWGWSCLAASQHDKVEICKVAYTGQRANRAAIHLHIACKAHFGVASATIKDHCWQPHDDVYFPGETRYAPPANLACSCWKCWAVLCRTASS